MDLYLGRVSNHFWDLGGLHEKLKGLSDILVTCIADRIYVNLVISTKLI